MTTLRTAGSLRTTAFAPAALAGSAAMASEASAMPANGLIAATEQIGSTVEQVRYVCGPYRCGWRPGPYWGRRYYAYYGGGPYWHRPWGGGGWGGGGWGSGGWGWHHWGWHRWGWHRHWW
jgi:hypothetical protein